MNGITIAARNFRQARKALCAKKLQWCGRTVYVESPSYTGQAVASVNGCEPDQITVHTELRRLVLPIESVKRVVLYDEREPWLRKFERAGNLRALKSKN